MLPSPALSLSRRDALRRILAMAALAATAGAPAGWAEEERAAAGIGWDPDLLRKEIPWPRLLTPEEKRTLTALGDVLIPADEFGPAASAVGVPDFLDEWVSAPYEQQVRERKILREGLERLGAEARARCEGREFAEATPAEQATLVEEGLQRELQKGAPERGFFLLLRDRVAGGYYTTPEGWKALGYTGNVPLPAFAGPPRELRTRLGV